MKLRETQVKLLASRIINKSQQKWLLELEDYIIYTSKNEIAGILPKEKSFILNNYWDDMALAGYLCEGNKKYVVFGSGVCSFMPLLRSVNQSTEIHLYDLCSDINSFAKEIISGLKLNYNLSKWFEKDVSKLEEIDLGDTGSLFIDLYLDEGVAPIVFDRNFHSKLAEKTLFECILFANLYHGRNHERIKKILGSYLNATQDCYSSHFIISRENASTVVCCKFTDKKTEELLRNASSSLGLNLNITNLKELDVKSLKSINNDLKFDSSRTNTEPMLSIIKSIKDLDAVTIARKMRASFSWNKEQMD